MFTDEIIPHEMPWVTGLMPRVSSCLRLHSSLPALISAGEQQVNMAVKISTTLKEVAIVAMVSDCYKVVNTSL